MDANKIMVTIPKPFDKYYNVVSNEEALKHFGFDSFEDVKLTGAEGKHGFNGVEDNEAYSDMHHLAWLEAKPRYEDKIAQDGFDLVELARNGDTVFLADEVAGRIYSVNNEILSLLGDPEASVNR